MAERLEIEPEYRLLLAAHGLDSLDGVCHWTGGQRLDKAGLEPWRQRWRMELTHPDGRREILYLKRFLSPPLVRQWQRWRESGWARSTAWVEWRTARELARLGIPAARAVAFGERMRAGREVSSFILLQEVSGKSLEQIAAEGRDARLTFGPDAVKALAAAVARFHRPGLVHRDLYLSHVFLRRGCRGTKPDDYVLIDLQRVFRPRWRARRWRVKDLAALAFSVPPDWTTRRASLQFLVHYFRSLSAPLPPGRGSHRAELHRLAGDIARREARMRRRAERRRSASPGPANGRRVTAEVS